MCRRRRRDPAIRRPVTGAARHVIATRRRALRIPVALFALSLLARPAAGQLEVTVVAPNGEPIAAAQVELWSGMKRGVMRVADRRGQVHFTAVEASAAVAVMARRIGFAPRRAPLPPGAPELRVVLEPTARVLPEISVASETPGCPQKEDPAARKLWDVSRRRYDDTTTLGRLATLQYAAGEVDSDSVGQFDPARLLAGQREANRPAVRGLRLDIAEHGYAWMLPERHYYWDYGVWGYPPLEADYAQHFTEALFGSRHTFTFDHSARNDEVVLHFCPRHRKQSGLEGTLRIGADGSFVSARWTYRNPKHDAEPAGAEAVFGAAPRPGGVPVLVAASGLFWRRLPSGRYYQRYQQYEGWVFTGGDTLPNLAEHR